MSAKEVGDMETTRARTIVFVHGIGNKPPENLLKQQWDKALFGFDLGERSRMAYWVNRELHGPPLGETEDKDELAAMMPKAEFGSFGTRDVSKGDRPTEREAGGMARLRKQMGLKEDGGFQQKLIPAPGFMREGIARLVTGMFLKDVRNFLFDDEQRQIMRDSLIRRLSTGGGPFVVIAHSQGTMIAYDVLANWSGPPIQVDLFVTLGSPLGLQEVQDQLQKFTGKKKLATPAVVKRWENFAAKGDPVSLDGELENDYAANATRVKVVDHGVVNPVRENHHSGIGYLSLPEVRSVVLEEINKALFQPVAEFTTARNLVSAMAAADDGERHHVLIELQDQKPKTYLHVLTDGLSEKDDPGYVSLDTSRARVRDWIRQQWLLSAQDKRTLGSLTDAEKSVIDDAVELEALHSYVSARLTRQEVERLAATLRNASVFRIFKNSVKSFHLRESSATVQATTAHRGYDADGRGVTWAVLDSGVDWAHPHFADGTIEKVFDCSQRSDEPVEVSGFGTSAGMKSATKGAPGWDGSGHGTHVCGIIAGGMDSLGIRGIAPKARLWSYKVLDDQGQGGDVKIIKALDDIYRRNEQAPQLLVHGVNLSLGGPFDAEVFGCGDTPLCKALRKLWRQGVIVVVSAGNEGVVDVPGVGPLNMALSIGEPANLEDSIVVGSVHATKPHLYGVSYFSSRGPTADGRAKPDVVAPGEKVLSCLAGGRGKAESTLYTRKSGTSMAAPHVSGLAACFLSKCSEFKGRPDEVKQRMMNDATDLKRDRMHQGAGLVNIVKMLINT